MRLQDLIVPVLIALTAMPLFVAAGYVARGHLHLVNGLDPARVRDPRGLARRLARLLAAAGFAMVGGAAAMVWAGGEPTRVTAVAVALVVVVNLIALALIITVARARHR
jgi:hypothetical protein